MTVQDKATPKQAPPKPKDRTAFSTTEGTFSAVANGKYIQTMSDERDAAVWREWELRAAVTGLDKLASPRMPGWEAWSTEVNCGRNDFELTMCSCFSMDPLNSVSFYQPLYSATQETFPVDEDNWYQATPFRATHAWEALAGGVFGRLPTDWTPEQLEEHKRLARLICGDAKAAVAETLSPTDKAALVATKEGLVAGLTMASMLPGSLAAPTSAPISWEPGTKSRARVDAGLATWARAAMAKHKERLNPKFVALVCEPDERPMLVFPFFREAFEHFNKDYERTAKFAELTIAHLFSLSEETAPGEEEDVTMQDVLDDTSRPIAERVAAIERLEAEARARAQARAQGYAQRDPPAKKRGPPAKKRKRRREMPWDEWGRRRRLREEGQAALRKQNKRA